MAAGLTLISLNVRGIRENVKRKSILEWCKNKRGDIIFLQETYSTPDVEARWRSEWEGSIYFSHGTNHSKGVLVLIASKLNINICDLKIDKDGRFILFKGEIQEVKFLFGNFYFPTRDKKKEQLQLLETIEKTISDTWGPDYSTVLRGDYNLIMDRKLDYVGSNIPAKNKVNDNFEDVFISHNLEDVWRKNNPSVKQFTFKQKQPVVQTRLDY